MPPKIPKKAVGAASKFIKKGFNKLKAVRQSLEKPASEFVSQSEAAIERTKIKPPKKLADEYLDVDMPADEITNMPATKMMVLKTKDLGRAMQFARENPGGGRAVYNPDTKTYFVWDGNKGLHATGKKALRQGKHDIGPGWDLDMGEDSEKYIKEQLRIYGDNAKVLKDEGIK